MTEMLYLGGRTVDVRRDGRVVGVPLTHITEIGDCDLDGALAHAMELRGTWIPVSAQSRARGVAPRNYANCG